MKDYFGFDVQFVQNITDIDDKIILRGRQAHLLSNFQSEHAQITEDVQTTTSKAFDAYIKKNLPLLSPGLKPEDFNKESAEKYAAVIQGKSVDGTGPPGDKEAKIKMHLKTAGKAVTALLSPSKSANEDVAKFWEGAEDVLLPYLDSLHGTSISSSDHGIFTALTKKYEDRFNTDMEALNVLPPDVVTRVSEYVPQIVAFTERIVSNGFAYQAGDGVYFDIAAFEKVKNNHYARLEPWNRMNTDLQADGEGALSTNKSGKRQDSDFSLWKTSKPGEPAWDSPWGPGRPGWHIECSVMASETLGSQIDIHSGGIDLCFPHHDNELAQSEAYWSTEGGHQWINYFLHMGHLSISGSKMSKSLKNFTTIREALARGDWTSRSLRIIFLLGGWHDGIEITDDMKKAGASFESYVTNFFLRIKDLEIHPNTTSTGTEDAKIKAALDSAKSKVHEALADSFDTPAAIRAIRGLIEDWNTADKAGLSDDVSRELGVFVTRILRIFGLDGKADPNDGGIGWSGIDIPEASKEFVYAASRLRDEIRQRAIAKDDLSEEALNSLITQDKPSKQQDAAAVPYAEILSVFQEDLLHLSQQKAQAKDFLELSDRLRDVHLWKAGVYLEDRTNAPAMVRPVDAELRAEREQKESIARQKAEAKQQREREEAEKKSKLAEQAKISPKEMFKTDEYSAWDDDGVPTKDKEGAEVPKSKAKKLRKEWEKQKKLHDEHLKSVNSS
ncbi:cysteinyl-tRNA synthetase [Paraconiothyrium brasiliense]|uniref:Cysteinyl-tRNA synthetase n=1 Tax=Paraconiothyrium brasiliense TaxID=300254 RepID=A0ABR3QP56_9PLEO